MVHSLGPSGGWASLLFLFSPLCSAFDFVTSGYATLTHYDLPYNYIASCGCVGASTSYPTAALNRLAYGSNTSFGPSCGLCFDLRLVSTPLAPPPLQEGQDGSWEDGIYFIKSEVDDGKTPNLVVKIIDLCPGVGGPWCNSTRNDDGTLEGNSLGSMVHFDLAWPSKAISKDFFPGDHDYGAWNVTYQAVSCERWEGYKDKRALGSDWAQETSACCPNDPPPSGQDATCPSYYDTVGLDALVAPNTSNPISKGKESSNKAPSSMPSSATTALAVAAASVLVGSLTLIL